MATINTSSLTGSSLDVASIVSQLMQVERRPLAALDGKIAQSQVRISGLGSFQSKLSALQDAVNRVQNPNSFKTYALTTSDSTVVGASIAGSAVSGRYDLSVTTLATNAVVNLPAGLDPLTQYDFKVGGPTGAVVSFTPTPVGGAVGVQAHYESLRDAFNADTALKGRFVAVLVDRGQGAWGLSIQGLKTGAENNIQLVFGPDAIPVAPANARAADDARFSINGQSLTRSSNAVSIYGLSMNLTKAGTAQIEVRESSNDTAPAMQALAEAYNALVAEQKTLTASNTDARLRGALNSDSSVSSIMRMVNAQLMGAWQSSTGASTDLRSMGLELSDSGQLVYKPSLISDSAVAQALLSGGLYMGSSASNNLSRTLSNALEFGGVLTERIRAEKNVQSDLTKRQAALEEKMANIQQRYTAQYAALDALLFRLNNTNTALKSALDAMANSNKSN
jgi:flagellar hook-associated protein 2